MLYGEKMFKNGKTVGYLKFKSGKKVYLNSKEKLELIQKINIWQWEAVEKYKNNLKRKEG
jgi:hypothetical protein